MADSLEDLRTGLAGRYSVERELGRGGMATVYFARDVRYDRAVAIKVLQPELAASLGAERFLREIKVAAQLQHPNILGLYESGDVNGLLFYVMPFVSGESLRDRLDREKQLPIEDAIRIARETAEALSYANDQGVIHRDIKPENILLQGGHALVADFGIARAVTVAGGEKLTRTGMAVGTPHYMSPEQSLGGDALDGRSDLYSLGCVLYEMLVGQPPFDGPNTMALLARHSMEAVPSLQIARPTIPDDLEQIVHQALAKTPADRFPSCKAFADALTEVDHELITIRTTSRAIPRRTGTYAAPAAAEPPSRSTTRNRLIGAGVLIAVAAAGAFALTRRGANPPSAAAVAATNADHLAVLYFDDQSTRHDLGYLADGLTDDLIRELNTVSGLTVISRNGVADYRGSTVSPDSIARALGVGTLVTGTVEQAGSDKIRVSVQLLDASGATFKRGSFEQPAGNPLAIRDSLTQQVSRFLRERLGEELKVRDALAGTTSAAAWALVQRAEQQGRTVDRTAATDTTGATARGFDGVDSLLVLASQQDPKWAVPPVLRAAVAYRRSRLAAGDPPTARQWAEKSIAFAEQGLGIEPSDADALELRGNARYWMWILHVEPDPAKAKALLASARGDLEQATKISPKQAGAWGSLSHLYNQLDDVSSTDAVLAARRAYEADAYLSNANQIIDRLFLSYYDLDQQGEAARWCDEGTRRFPDDPRFQSCQIWVMTMRGHATDVAKAWAILKAGNVIVPGRGKPEFQQRRATLGVAGVLARAGLLDSAKSIAKSAAKAGGDVDPARELAFIQAFVLTMAGDRAGALAGLKAYFAVNPDRRKGLAEDPGWWFRDLERDPEFRRLVSG